MKKIKELPNVGFSTLGEYGIFLEESQETQTKSKTTKQHLKSKTQESFPTPQKKTPYIPLSTNEMLAILPNTVQTVTELWNRRKKWVQAHTSLTLQIKGFCRRLCPTGMKDIVEEIQENNEPRFKKPLKNPKADELYAAIISDTKEHPLKETCLLATMPLLKARAYIAYHILEVEKSLENEARKLPTYEYCLNTRGLSPATLYAMIGEAPGINYRGLLDFRFHHNLWKRFGLSCSEIDGKRQQKRTGADAIKEGYSPQRRSVAWNWGATVIKVRGPYSEIYYQYKEEERQKAKARGQMVVPAAKIPKGQEHLYMSEGHVHNRAKRMMEKKILLDFWQMWQKLIDQKDQIAA